MKLWEICIREFRDEIDIVPVDYTDEEFYNSDGYSVWEQALAIANSHNIHIYRNKELAFVAKDDSGNVHGAVWTALEHDDDQDAEVFDFDVAVDKKSIGPARIGIRLIDTALQEFENLKAELGRVYIRVYVINPKLAKWLEYRRGFELEAQHGDGSAHMVYYGSYDKDDYSNLEDADEFVEDDLETCEFCGEDANENGMNRCEECGSTFCGECGDIFSDTCPDCYEDDPDDFELDDDDDYEDEFDDDEEDYEEDILGESSEYAGLEDADEFGNSCEFPTCQSPNAFWVCNDCGGMFCDDHIHGIALAGGSKDLCPECALKYGYYMDRSLYTESAEYSDLEDNDRFGNIGHAEFVYGYRLDYDRDFALYNIFIDTDAGLIYVRVGDHEGKIFSPVDLSEDDKNQLIRISQEAIRHGIDYSNPLMHTKYDIRQPWGDYYQIPVGFSVDDPTTDWLGSEWGMR